ncbi:MAG TPA: c-type cytochrome [Thermoanaerobaculia bacterium]
MKRVTVAFAIGMLAASLSAQQQTEPKNVQVLKGLTPGQLIRTMQFIAASLGVNCDFCHVIKSPTDRDFASDDKEEKRTAREMMHLVIDTNAKFFHERPMVSCVTCHRGSTEPLSVPVLPVALPPQRPEAPAQAASPRPSRDEIVAKYAKALGNIDEKALATMEMKGTRETSRGSGPFVVVIAPGKVRATATIPEGEMVNVVNGSQGWIRDQRGTQAMQALQVETMNLTLDAYRLTLPSEIPAEARVGKDKAGNKDAWVITMPFGTNGTQRLYFDTQSGLLVRRLRLTRVPIGQIPQQTDFDDYRDVGGMKLPFVVRVDTIDPRGGATRRYSEIKLNAKVDDSLFAEPK